MDETNNTRADHGPTRCALAAAVTGGLHRRLSRPGQDAAHAVVHGDALIGVVADGCGSAESSEVGARLGVQLWTAAIARQLDASADITDRSTWDAARAEVLGALRQLVDVSGLALISSHLLFTSLVAVVRGDVAVVMAIGDGRCGGVIDQRFLADDNAPDYLAYALLGQTVPMALHVAPAPASGCLWLGTDGVMDLDVESLTSAARTSEALRRQLELWARPTERIDWTAQRVHRAPAQLSDDGALAVLRWGPS